MKIQPGLNRVVNLDIQAIRREVEAQGFVTFVMPENGIVDGASFFNAVRATFPLDPPINGCKSWDGLEDSLWEGLYQHPAPRIAILWPKTQDMANSAPDDFKIALSVLVDVANVLADTRATCDRPKEIAILVG